MSIEVRHIPHIQSLTHHGSFTKAAAALGLTQSALSRSILNLEEELQVSLFERGRGKLKITQFGELILSRGQRVLTELEDLKQEIANLKGETGGRVNAVFESGASHLIMGDILINLHLNNPDIHTNFTSGEPSKFIDDLSNGKYDILVGPTSYTYGVRNLAVEVCQTFQIRAIVRADHPLTQLANPNLGDLLKYTYVGYRFAPELYEQWATDPSINVAPAMLQESIIQINSDNIPSISKILLETDAFTWGIGQFFAEDVLAGNLVLLELPGTPIKVDLGIAYPANRTLLPAVLILKEEVKKQYQHQAKLEAELLERITKKRFKDDQ